MTPPSVESYGTPTLSIEEVFPAKNLDNDEAHFQVENNNNDEAHFQVENNNKDGGEHFQADSSIKKTWSAFEHFPDQTGPECRAFERQPPGRRQGRANFLQARMEELGRADQLAGRGRHLGAHAGGSAGAGF